MSKTCLFTYTEGRKIVAMCGLDRQQAITVLGILEQPEELRKASGQALEKCIAHLKARRMFKPDFPVGVAQRTRGGIVTQQRPPLPARACQFLARVCLSPNTNGLDLLMNDLKRFIAGEDVQLSRPFLEADFAKPIILPG